MSTTPNAHPSFKQIARYGVPAAVLLFYLTVSQRFDYTPYGTFATVNEYHRVWVDSLWTVLLAFGDMFGIEVLLFAKVLSLLWTSCAILFTYLIAQEMLADNLLAFFVALTFSTQAWLLQLGPSGSGLAFVLFLTLAAIFFMLRNDYLLATLFAGLGACVSWQVVVLFLAILFDAHINSMDRNRARKLATSLLLVFASVLLPWVVYVVNRGTVLIPDELSRSDVPTLSPEMVFGTVLLIGLMFVGIVLFAARERELLRLYTAVVLWTVASTFIHRMLFVVALPLILVFAFLAARMVVRLVSRSSLPYIACMMLAAAVLAYNQFVARPPVERQMDAASATTSQLKFAGLWLNTHLQDSETVLVPPVHEEILRYYLEKGIGNEHAGFILSKEMEIAGYDIVFDPVMQNPHLLAGADHYKVWRRR